MVKSEDQWLFPFLKLLENMYSQIIEKAIDKQLQQLSEFERTFMTSTKWVNSEEARLEHAVRVCKQRTVKQGIQYLGDAQWLALSEIVESKTADQCKTKCLSLSQKDKKPAVVEEEEKEEEEDAAGPDIHQETEEI